MKRLVLYGKKPWRTNKNFCGKVGDYVVRWVCEGIEAEKISNRGLIVKELQL